jgi:predicted Zn-dependent peptidase
MDEMVFANWSNAHSTIGSMEDLDAATLTDVRDFFRTYYSPNNAVLSIAGDVNAAKTEALVKKYFGAIPSQKAPPKVNVAEPQAVAAQKAEVEDKHAQMPAIAIAWKTPARGTPDFYPLALLKAILCDGESARLYQRLVKDKKLALEVSGTLEARRGPGQIGIFSVHKAEVKPEDLQTAVIEEIDRIKTDGVSAGELAKVKNQHRLGRFLGVGAEGEYGSLQTALGRAMALAEFTMFDGDPLLINTEIDRYLAVTEKQIKDVAARHFGTTNRSVLFIRAANKPQASSPDKQGN